MLPALCWCARVGPIAAHQQCSASVSYASFPRHQTHSSTIHQVKDHCEIGKNHRYKLFSIRRSQYIETHMHLQGGMSNSCRWPSPTAPSGLEKKKMRWEFRLLHSRHCRSRAWQRDSRGRTPRRGLWPNRERQHSESDRVK